MTWVFVIAFCFLFVFSHASGEFRANRCSMVSFLNCLVCAFLSISHTSLSWGTVGGQDPIPWLLSVFS